MYLIMYINIYILKKKIYIYIYLFKTIIYYEPF